eukprot:g73839.t1
MKEADSFNAQEIANTLHACVVLNRPDPALFSRWIKLLSLRYEHVSLDLTLPAPLADACKSSVMKQTAETSNFHMEVSEVLRNEGVPHFNEDTSSGLWVDICLTGHVDICLTGHQCGNPRYKFATLFKHRLLRAMGWRVVSVPFYEWDVLRQAERAPYLRRKLRELSYDKSKRTV